MHTARQLSTLAAYAGTFVALFGIAACGAPKPMPAFTPEAKAEDDALRSARYAAYEKGCAEGDGLACALVGWRSVDDDGRLKEHASDSLPGLQKACESGEAFGCYVAGRILLKRSDEAPDDLDKGYEALGRACKLGFAFACKAAKPDRPMAGRAAMTGSHGGGISMAEFQEGLLEYLGKKCDSGQKFACLGDAIALKRFADRQMHNDPGDGARIVKELGKACDAGVAVACSYAAFVYQTGVRVPKDDAAAKTWAKKGCDGGDKTGCDFAK